MSEAAWTKLINAAVSSESVSRSFNVSMKRFRVTYAETWLIIIIPLVLSITCFRYQRWLLGTSLLYMPISCIVYHYKRGTK